MSIHKPVFKIERTSVDSAIDWSPHHHAYINPYNGCTACCPYCFWLSQEGWEGRVQIRHNIAQQLEAVLPTWPKDEFIYLGSVCDPFMELEKTEHLSVECLKLIQKYEIPLLITTSALSDAIRGCVDILKSMKQRVILVVELSRVDPIEEFNLTGHHIGIENANYLYDNGLEVWATLAPILPHITDIDKILEALNPSIPLYVDSLQCTPGGIQARKVMDWIRSDYPAYKEEYARIVDGQDLRYFDGIIEKAAQNPRIRFFPYDLT